MRRHRTAPTVRRSRPTGRGRPVTIGEPTGRRRDASPSARPSLATRSTEPEPSDPSAVMITDPVVPDRCRLGLRPRLPPLHHHPPIAPTICNSRAIPTGQRAAILAPVRPREVRRTGADLDRGAVSDQLQGATVGDRGSALRDLGGLHPAESVADLQRRSLAPVPRDELYAGADGELSGPISDSADFTGGC